MPFLFAALKIAAAAVVVIGGIIYNEKGNDPPPPPPPPPPRTRTRPPPPSPSKPPPSPPQPPPRDSHYYSGSSYNSGSSWNQTQQSYRPPPSPPSYTYSPPITYPHYQTTSRIPAPPEYDVYHSHYTRATTQTQSSDYYYPNVAPPYTQSSRQTQSSTHTQTQSSIRTQTQSSTRTQAQSSTRTQTQAPRPYSSLFETVHDDAHELPGYGYSQTCSHVHANVYTVSELAAPVVDSSEPRSDELAGLEGLDLAKKLREQARRRGREMTKARSRAKNAQKKGTHGAAHKHTQRAKAHESAIKELDKRAAEIIFTEKNKVCASIWALCCSQLFLS